MSPLIITTGNKELAFKCRLLPGETDEAIRAAVTGTTASANYDILGERKAQVTIDLFTRKIGMPNELARELVDAAIKGIPGVGIEFKTIFLPRRKNCLPRRYEDFKPIK